MFEADELCQRIAVITGGEIVAEGAPSALKAALVDRTVIEIETYGIDEGSSTSCARFRAWRRSRWRLAIKRRSPSSRPPPARSLVQPLLGALEGTTVGRVVSREPTLEDAYVELVRERRDRASSSPASGCSSCS